MKPSSMCEQAGCSIQYIVDTSKTICLFFSRFFTHLSQHGDKMKFDLNQASVEAR